MNNLSYDEFVHALKHNAKVSAHFKYIPKGFDVHHLDEDTLNDDISNLGVLPHDEHARLHTTERNADVEYVREVKVVRITDAGEEMTYDVQMESPANNFAANGIFVHNTGKSTLTAVLAKAIERKYNTPTHRERIAFCAYTGKAANVLQQKLRAEGIHTSREGYPHYGGTIHSLLYKPVVNNGAIVGWEKKSAQEVDYDLIVVDEASMVDDEVLADILSMGRPVLAVGDHGQLPPVRGQGSLMADPQLRLEKIHRQAADNSIIKLATHVREQGDLPEKWDDDQHVRFITFNQMFDILEPLYAEEELEEIAILTYTNQARLRMNHQARCMRRRMDVSPEPVKGDQFICLRNTFGTLFNGMRGYLDSEPKDLTHWYTGKFFFPDDDLEVEGSCLKVQIGREKTFGDFEEIAESLQRPVKNWTQAGLLFDYGYALTVHKSQGSQFKNVFMIYERKPGPVTRDDFKRFLYTGITRASENLYMVVG